MQHMLKIQCVRFEHEIPEPMLHSSTDIGISTLLKLYASASVTNADSWLCGMPPVQLLCELLNGFGVRVPAASIRGARQSFEKKIDAALKPYRKKLHALDMARRRGE
eukprot:5468388-Pleurochrysis_carterae.AAC.9